MVSQQGGGCRVRPMVKASPRLRRSPRQLRSPRSKTATMAEEPLIPEVADEDRVEVIVVGAGQAGLAIGFFLARQGRRFLILEAADSVGAAWRDRWDSLALFTPRRYDALPGLGFPGDPDGYPTRDEVISYLRAYAETYELPVVFDSAVRSLTPIDGGFQLEYRGQRRDGRPGRRGDRSVPAAVHAGAGRSALTCGLPDAQHGLPATAGHPGRDSAGCGWGQHRIPDRHGARRHTLGPSLGRLTADAAAAEDLAARPVLVAHQDRVAQDDASTHGSGGV